MEKIAVGSADCAGPGQVQATSRAGGRGPGQTVLCLGAAGRLGMALAAVALIWACVAMALGWVG